MPEQHRPASGRLLPALAGLLLLIGLWLWGREATEVPGASPAPSGGSGPTAGGPAALGLPSASPLLPAVKPPLAAPARPLRLDIPAARVRAPVTASGLDGQGAVAAPPYDRPGTVAWYEGGARPGADGVALLVGHVDTSRRPAVFHRLSRVRRGDRVSVLGADGSVARFTVDDVEVIDRDRFDARRVYGGRVPGRAELRLLTCGGTFDRAAGVYSANVVVSAYLTGGPR